MKALFLAMSILIFNVDTCVNSQNSSSLKDLIELAILSEGSPKRYWVADIDLVEFKRADTLSFIADKNYTSHAYRLNGHCQFICWEFLENQLINGFEYQLCQEPPIARILANENMTYQLLTDNKIEISLDNEIMIYKLYSVTKVTISESISEVFKIELIKV